MNNLTVPPETDPWLARLHRATRESGLRNSKSSACCSA